MRSMGLPFAQNMHGGPDFRHILRKFTGLKEGVGENIPNTVLGNLNDVILLLDI